MPCADPNNWNDRILPVITSDTTLLHCFGNCVTDGTCGVDPCLQVAPYLEDFAAGPTCWTQETSDDLDGLLMPMVHHPGQVLLMI